MKALPRALARVAARSGENNSNLDDIALGLHHRDKEAVAGVNDTGIADCPDQIVHSDWHPGNMVFRGPRVVAVIDCEASRMQQRILDAANGAL